MLHLDILHRPNARTSAFGKVKRGETQKGIYIYIYQNIYVTSHLWKEIVVID
jgi:hypothetical protein